MEPSFTEGGPARGRYRPSGRVDLVRFGALAAGVLAVAAIFSILLWLGFEHRFYAPLFFTFGGLMIVGGLGLLAVRVGRCRSGAVAVLAGLAAGLVIQPGHHLIAYGLGEGAGALGDIAGFVRFLDARFAAVEIDWGVPPRLADDEEVEPTRIGHIYLWAAAGAEIVLVPLLCCLPALLRVRRDPFCEGAGEWAQRSRLAFLPDASESLLGGLGDGRVVKVAAASVVELHPNQPAVIGLVDRCPLPSSSGVAGWLSLRLTTGDAVAATALEALFPYHRLLVRCAELTADEIEGLRALAPEGSTAAVAPSWLLDLEGEEDAPAGELARIDRVEQSEPPPAADSRTRRIAEVLNLMPILSGLAVGFGLVATAAFLEEISGLVTAVCGVSGLVAMMVGVWFGLSDPNLVGDRYLLRRLRRRVSYRGGASLRPEDPDVLWAALVPRSVWTDARGKENIDHGLVATRGGSVLYEGDRVRMRIPADSIVGIDLEPLSVDQYQTWHFVVVEVRAEDGRHTLPFVRIGAPLGETLFRSKKRRAEVLLDRVTSIFAGELRSEPPGVPL